MWYVYFLKSKVKDFVYVGSTNDLERRLEEHNSGKCQSTKAYCPFDLNSFIAVQTETKPVNWRSILKLVPVKLF